MSTDQRTGEANERLARRFPDAVATEGNIDLIDEICSADVIDHTSRGDVRGREALKERSEYLHAAFPDLSVAVDDAIVEDDTVAFRMTFRGTHEGEFMGIEPTDSEVEIANILFSRIEDGKIAERWLHADMLGIMQQIGAVPAPDATTDFPSTTTEQPDETKTAVHENKALARRWNEEVWRQQNLDAIDDLVAEDFVGYDPSLPEPIRGPGGVREVVEMLFSSFSDVEVDLEAVVAAGDRIATRQRITGTHAGEYMDIEPTGKDVETTVAAFQRVEDGKFVEEQEIVDHLGLLTQLDAVTPQTR